MTVAVCPSCQESVTVPVDATADCVVRCPLCHEEFQLEAFLNQLPPSLIVLDDGSGVQPQQQADASPEPDASSSNVLGAFAASRETADSSDSVPAFDFTAGSVAEEGDEPAQSPPRRKRSQKNPTLEVIKIVAGAMLAIPAAQLILWMAPGDWKRDLLGIGPAVSRVAPWIVPEKFRDRGTDTYDDQSLLPEPKRDAASGARRAARPRVSNGSAMPQAGTRQAKTTREESTPPQETLETQDNTEHGSPSGEPTDEAAAAPSANQEAHTPPAPAATASAPTKVLVRGVRDAPQYTLADLRAALETALQASIAWDTNPDQSDQQRAQLTQRFYESFAHLSEAVTYPPPQDPGTGELVTALSDVLSTFARQPKKLAMIGNQTSAWLDQPARPNQGIFLFGTVKRIKMSGQIFETELELAALQKRTVTVVSRIDPRQTFGAGDRILMLGAIVEQPARNLLGYEGNEPMVVMGGFPVILR